MRRGWSFSTYTVISDNGPKFMEADDSALMRHQHQAALRVGVVPVGMERGAERVEVRAGVIVTVSRPTGPLGCVAGGRHACAVVAVGVAPIGIGGVAGC